MDGPLRATAGRRPARHARGRPAPVATAPVAGRINLGGLDQLTGYVVRRAQVWLFQDFKRALRDVDITPAQFAVMKIVAANPGIAQARVAEVLSIERARLVDMLDRLEARRWIKRSRSATDRRSHALHI